MTTEEAGESVELRAALRLVSNDMHNTSTRPCNTCRQVGRALGQPFGCYAYQIELSRRAMSTRQETPHV
jgi:hypothetical protein